jgi:hypothetical protein
MKTIEITEVGRLGRQGDEFVEFRITHKQIRGKHLETASTGSKQYLGQYAQIHFYLNYRTKFDSRETPAFHIGRHNLADKPTETFFIHQNQLDSFLKAIDLFNEEWGRKTEANKPNETVKTNKPNENDDPIFRCALLKISEVWRKKRALMAKEQSLKENIATLDVQYAYLHKQIKALLTVKMS